MSDKEELPAPGPDARRIRIALIAGVALLCLGVLGLYLRAASRTNHTALADAPKPVTVKTAQATTFRPVHMYVGTIDAWNTAQVGPQYVSAYVSTVLFRPGASVKRGEVLATLDCRNSSAQSREIAAKARSLEERQVAVEHEAQRVDEMARGNFASKNEAEQLAAKASSEKADIESLRASLVSRGLEVDDCILRAPFTGEVSERYVDPGAYVRPGNAVLRVIDRSTVRVVGDVPESDFGVVEPGQPVDLKVQATGQVRHATVSRRAPAADDDTRTARFEVDLPNADHSLPAGTTALMTLHYGDTQNVMAVPLSAATLRGDHASLFIVENSIAKRVDVPVVGEAGGTLYLTTALAAGASVVVEGRALLDDGDRVAAK